MDFSEVLKRAAALKTDQLAVDRRRYDSYAEWYQHSMFTTDTAEELRSGPFAERIQAAIDLKDEGNEHLKTDDYYKALHAYGAALALFRWLKNSNPDWKRKVRLILLSFLHLVISLSGFE